MSLALVILAVLVLLAVLAARAAAGVPALVPGEDDPGELATSDADLFDSEGEPHAPPPDLSAGGVDARSDASAAAPGARTLPTTAEVIAAAMRAAGLAGDPASGWRTRARLSGLVPQLSARVGQDDTWRDVADPTLGHVIAYGVTASWRLERLVWDPSELRIATVDVLRRRERRRLAWYVISLYRAWRRTQNEDLAAQLDVITDGWFSQHAAGRPGGPFHGVP